VALGRLANLAFALEEITQGAAEQQEVAEQVTLVPEATTSLAQPVALQKPGVVQLLAAQVGQSVMV